jgi:hypothetical protein
VLQIVQVSMIVIFGPMVVPPPARGTSVPSPHQRRGGRSRVPVPPEPVLDVTVAPDGVAEVAVGCRGPEGRCRVRHVR